MRISTHYLVIFSSYLLSTLIYPPPIAMEKINLGYSTNNIPLPTRHEYMKRFIEKTEQFLWRLRWKVYPAFSKLEQRSRKENMRIQIKKLPTTNQRPGTFKRGDGQTYPEHKIQGH